MRAASGHEVEVEVLGDVVALTLGIYGEWMTVDLTPLEAIGLAEQLRKAAGMDEVAS